MALVENDGVGAPGWEKKMIGDELRPLRARVSLPVAVRGPARPGGGVQICGGPPALVGAAGRAGWRQARQEGPLRRVPANANSAPR